MEKKHIIKENENENEKERIDKKIQKLEKNLSRATIQKLIEEGNILVNNKKTKSSYKINEGDQITIKIIKKEETYLKKQKIDIDIIYEDKDIIIVNKEKGMCVHPGNGNKENTLVNAILDKFGNTLSNVGGELRPGIVHRLDKNTSRINNIGKKQ